MSLSFFLFKTTTFIQRGYIILIKSDSKDLNIILNDRLNVLSIKEFWTKWIMFSQKY